MGRAYAAAKMGKRVKCSDEKTKRSFRNGVNSVRNSKAKNKRKQQCANCGAPLYVVNGDGVVVGKVAGGAV